MERTRRITSGLVPALLAGLLAGLPALAGEPSTRQLPLTDASFMEIDAMLVSVRGRPNEEARLRGLKHYVDDRPGQALEQFERAAGYADKFSQHYLSLMHWHGVGTPVDRVRAYIWSDLAAERGNPRLLAIREKMWAGLSEAEQAQVLTHGPDFYARYGDDVAMRRAEDEMRRFARNMTGSRVGYRNQRMEAGGGPANGSFAVDTGNNAAAYMISVAGSPDELYGREGGLARLNDYWREQDRLLEGDVRVGPVSRSD
ncbi:hypothetical protein [Marilutibacter chinensis]|uniref:Sel1 repeat family protein n=1 Tax=Marilutibacter chinensis TaxID=2912247 RepID=A0ABS9HY32_9GAMM|nr:hypothetical protein [Lysobacter chinensis]MCF7221772.1 hypothetical protein [Lysobacter chinensis]MCF7223708.1 hypothetical protein [Lysobacter chinensis]